jgi:tetratricopeptide (TPR) repeat protein
VAGCAIHLAAQNSDSTKEKAIANLVKEGNQSLSAGNPRAAADAYQKALQLNPGNPKIRYNLTVALDKLGEFAAEQKELEKIIAQDPDLAVAQSQLGLLALRNGHTAEAELRFKKALAIDPAFAEAQNSLGVLYGQQGKNAEAASLFRQAMKNDPQYAQAHLNLGLLLEKQGSFLQAEQELRAAAEIDSSDPDAYTGLGLLQSKTGQQAEAVKNLQHAVALEPTSAEAHLNLGIALMDQADRSDVLKELSEAARLNPDLAGAHYNLGRYYVDSGKYEDAHRELDITLRLQPNDPGALYFLAVMAKQENHLEQSTELLQKVIAQQPGNVDAQFMLGQNLEHLGDTSGAIVHWKAAVQANPEHSQALFNLAKALRKMHDPDAQLYQDRFDALLKNQQVADRVSALGNSSLEAAKSQNWPLVMQQMNEAIQLCGDCPQGAHLHKNLALFYQQMGNIAEAKQEWRTALQLAPDDADAQKALAALAQTP